MKKLIILCLGFLLYSMGCMAAVTQSTAMKKAYDYVKAKLPSEYVFMYNPTKTKTILISGNSKKVLSEDCWVFFLDENPTANWGHKCRYIYVSVANGNVKSSVAFMPPANPSNWKESTYSQRKSASNSTLKSTTSYKDGRGLVLPNLYSKIPLGSKALNDKKGKTYAVIISGGADSVNNHRRYWNDCSMHYQILRRVYNIPRSNIFVYMSDGTYEGKDLHLGDNWDDHTSSSYYIDSPQDLDGDGTKDINGAAKKADLRACFNNLRSILKENDHLYIFTTDHGSCDINEVGNGLCLWNQTLYPNELATMLQGIKAPIAIVMEQCYSGCFIHPLETLGQKITIATAAHRKETSVGDSYYNPFAYKWACAISGYDVVNDSYTNADKDGDNEITMLEAFNHARYAHWADTAQYWSYGGVQYGEQTVNVFAENSSYWLVVGQLGNYQTADATVGCDYGCGRSSAPAKNVTINSAINNQNRTYLAGHKLTANSKITNSQINYQAYDKVLLKKGFKVNKSDSKFNARRVTCMNSNVKSEAINNDVIVSIEEDDLQNIEYIDMSDYISDASIQLYPNPTHGLISIVLSEMKGEKNVIVTNTSGAIIYEDSFRDNQTEIDLSGNTPGIYFVQVVSNDKSVVTKVLLK
ncbi:MAG: T9SS type A sorting domain-containing protein [Paludibacteraceae bacterium]|nr:T9SS type A sorting domain-containing protein [Paludibacteraceae bacterium]